MSALYPVHLLINRPVWMMEALKVVRITSSIFTPSVCPFPVSGRCCQGHYRSATTALPVPIKHSRHPRLTLTSRWEKNGFWRLSQTRAPVPTYGPGVCAAVKYKSWQSPSRSITDRFATAAKHSRLRRATVVMPTVLQIPNCRNTINWLLLHRQRWFLKTSGPGKQDDREIKRKTKCSTKHTNWAIGLKVTAIN